MPSRTIAWAGSRWIGRPSNRTAPRAGWSRPTMVRRVVVLPAPLRPSRTVTAPGRVPSETPWRMWCWPIQVWMPSTSRTGSGTGGAPAEVGGLDVGIRADRLGRVVRDEPAVLEHGHGVGERQDHVDLVLDQEDGPLAPGLERLDQRDD